MIFDKSNKKNTNLQKLLDVIYDNPNYYPGSFHQDVDVSDILDCIYDLLFDKGNTSVHIIVNKSSGNNIDLIVDKVE